jgi:glycosyltransferase involved in cell wall biosynthesis
LMTLQSRLFSIVIPVKDRTPLLYRALSSLRLQSFKDFEVVVVDDNSSEDIARVTASFGDLDIHLVKQASVLKGACAARNLGSDKASGRYIAYLDSDDIFLPEKLEVFARHIQQNPADLLTSYLLVYRGTDRLQARPQRPPRENEPIDEFFYIADQRIQSSSIVISKELFSRTRWNESLRKVQDSDFFIRARQKCGQLSFVPEPLAVLFDNELQGRISNASAEANIWQWLNSAQCPLSEKAKSGFRFYALSHEISKRSRLEALRLMVRDRRAVNLKIQAKTLYRMLTPAWVFKKTATLIRGQNSHYFSAALGTIEELERQASEFEAFQVRRLTS